MNNKYYNTLINVTLLFLGLGQNTPSKSKEEETLNQRPKISCA